MHRYHIAFIAACLGDKHLLPRHLGNLTLNLLGTKPGGEHYDLLVGGKHLGDTLSKVTTLLRRKIVHGSEELCQWFQVSHDRSHGDLEPFTIQTSENGAYNQGLGTTKRVVTHKQILFVGIQMFLTPSAISDIKVVQRFIEKAHSLVVFHRHHDTIDIVLMNAGASLYVAGKTDSIREGVKLAAELIESGKAVKKIDEMAEVSNG
jgi:hypothetical protein